MNHGTVCFEEKKKIRETNEEILYRREVIEINNINYVLMFV